ncbi:MAG: hypothetical protein D6796_10285 [Caldilineae bacterium]|nr:MAG: hypothetical protein D6796_10285 [Caldilineae bacterium]
MAGFYGKHSSGGGVFLTGEHIFLEDNLVVQNVTSQSNLEGSYSSLIIGGGIVALGGDVTAINNQIVSNTAVITSMSPSGIVLGGGIVVNGTEVQLIHNTIRGNVGVESGYYLSQGGGMYLEDIGHLVLADNLVEGNIAAFAGQSGDGGGGVIARYNAPESVVVADRNIIQNNVGSFSRGGIGGGMLVGNFRPNIPPLEITFRDNQILSNTATVSGTFGAGGGMVIAEGHVWMSGNLFRNNSVRLCGGGVFFSKSEGVLENTVFIQNRAALGGAALAVDDHSDIRMLHSTFTENDGGDESGILMSHWDDAFSTLAMTNTIFATHTTGISITAHNTVTLHSVLWYNTPVPMIAQSATTVIADHQHWGDPRFAVDGYHLKPASAAIGQGIDTPVIYDIDGQPRRFPPDLGADEYWRMSFYLPMVIRYR